MANNVHEKTIQHHPLLIIMQRHRLPIPFVGFGHLILKLSRSVALPGDRLQIFALAIPLITIMSHSNILSYVQGVCKSSLNSLRPWLAKHRPRAILVWM